MTDPVLRLEHLGRTVAGKTVVDDVSLEVGPGEFLAVVGPSGAGKSSLLRLLNRLDEPTSGSVYLDGVDYRTLPPRDLRRRVGLMLQGSYLFPGTVASNVRYGPAQRGITLPDAVVEDLLGQVGLAGFAARDVAQLSGGEAQRVSLARALANQPEVLLLDEPTAALNEELRVQVEAAITAAARARALTCILVTHDDAQAVRFASRVALLETGRLVKVGTPAEVIDANPMA